MYVGKLIVLQDGFRDEESFPALKRYVEQGGSFKQKDLFVPDRPIVLNEFDDGMLAIRDGHHRCAAIYRWRRGQRLREGEYKIERKTYSEYRTPNPAVGWVTPFDPLTEVRLADCSSYRDLIKNPQHPLGVDWVIERHKKMYTAKRIFWTLEEMTEAYLKSTT